MVGREYLGKGLSSVGLWWEGFFKGGFVVDRNCLGWGCPG